MSEHTPGPWHVRYDEHCDLYHVQSSSPSAEGPDVASFCTSADARLIAAAPDLLEALADTLFEAVECRTALHESSVRPDGSYDEEFAADIARLDGIISRASAAIARATGQEDR